MKSKQSGITLIGFLFILAIAGFFAYMALKLVPQYVKYYSVVKAMNEVASESLSGKSQDEVRRDFMYKLSFQYADDVMKPQDIKFITDNGNTTLQVDYDKRVHFIYNIDFLLHFEKSVQLNASLY
jgi:hypothetical protein